MLCKQRKLKMGFASVTIFNYYKKKMVLSFSTDNFFKNKTIKNKIIAKK